MAKVLILSIPEEEESLIDKIMALVNSTQDEQGMEDSALIHVLKEVNEQYSVPAVPECLVQRPAFGKSICLHFEHFIAFQTVIQELWIVCDDKSMPADETPYSGGLKIRGETPAQEISLGKKTLSL